MGVAKRKEADHKGEGYGMPLNKAQLLPGESLEPEQFLRSPNGRYVFKYQDDGNLVLYRSWDGRPLWESETDGSPAGVCIMQNDGNLVIYDPGGQPLWEAHTWDNPGSRLLVQDDGNVVLYRPDNVPLFSLFPTDSMDPVLPSQAVPEVNPSSLLVKELIGNLTTAQLWAVVVAIVTAASAVAVAAYWLGTVVAGL